MLENPSPIPPKSSEEIELENNKKILSSLFASRSAYFRQDEGNLDQKKIDDKKNFIEEFLEPYLANFTTLKQKWQGGEVVKNTEIVADFLAEKIDSLMEKYLPSSPQENNNFEKSRSKILRAEDPNKIKLKSGENLIVQLKQNGFSLNDLEKINNKINMTTIINPFSQDNQSIPIKLKDGRELRLDVKQYAEDLVEYNQLQKNTDANFKDSSQSHQIKLSGPLELYGKHKFNEKFPQEGAKIPLSNQDIESIEAIQANANASDKKREEFAKKFGFTIPENKSQNTSKQPENKASETLQSTEPQREAIDPAQIKTSPSKGILKNSDSTNTPDLRKRVTWAERVKENNSGKDQNTGRS